MNTIFRSCLLKQSTAGFRQCLVLSQHHLFLKPSQSCAAQYQPFSSSFNRVSSLHTNRSSQAPNDLTQNHSENVNKLARLQPPYVHSNSLPWLHPKRGITADTKTTAITIWEDLKQIRFAPVPALVLGFSGLIPFVTAPTFMIASQAFSSQILFAQTAYGACILSFLGGVRWGFVIPEENAGCANWLNFGYSVTPSLVAWTALLLPQPLSVLLVMGGIAGSAYFDTAVRGYPPWFKGLRFTLSFGAILSLWTAFLCQYMLGTPPDKEAAKEDDSK